MSFLTHVIDDPQIFKTDSLLVLQADYTGLTLYWKGLPTFSSNCCLGGQQSARALASRHERHRHETTLLYQIVDQHYPEFLAQLAAQGRSLPNYMQREFADFLKCGLLIGTSTSKV